MRLTTKGRYAVTAMLDLSINASKGPVTLSDISKRQDISLSYLEQLFSKLRKQELVSSVRGPGGGYLLGKKDSEINVAQIIDAVSESLDTTKCRGKGDCQGGETCLTHHRFLSDITLADLVSKREIERIARSQSDRAQQGVDQSKADSGMGGEQSSKQASGLERIVASSL